MVVVAAVTTVSVGCIAFYPQVVAVVARVLMIRPAPGWQNTANSRDSLVLCRAEGTRSLVSFCLRPSDCCAVCRESTAAGAG